GRHRTTVSVFPHATGLTDVVREAEALNTPLRVIRSSGREPQASGGGGVNVDHSGVQVSAVKLADDGSGDLIVRLFEAVGDRADVTVALPWPIGSAERANLLEDKGDAVAVNDGAAHITMRPFELATMRLRR